MSPRRPNVRWGPTRLWLGLAAGLIAVGVQVPANGLRAQAEKANPYAVILVEFGERLEDYLSLRNKVRANLPAQKPTDDPVALVVRQERLAEGVRRARASAHAGELFAPDIAAVLRDTIANDFKRRTPQERAAALQEVPAGLRLRVNDAYPKEVPLATVPPRLLAALPRLPDGLEYRFVGRRLILHDTIANLVVDVLDRAVPPR